MTTEFNLSEKIMFQMGDEMLDIDNQVISVQDVKEFIRLLKKGLANDCTDCNNWNVNLIDKLSGERLK